MYGVNASAEEEWYTSAGPWLNLSASREDPIIDLVYAASFPLAISGIRKASACSGTSDSAASAAAAVERPKLPAMVAVAGADADGEICNGCVNGLYLAALKTSPAGVAPSESGPDYVLAPSPHVDERVDISLGDQGWVIRVGGEARYYTTGFSQVVYRAFRGFCRDESNEDVKMVAADSAATEAECADECSQQALEAGCSAFEWFPDTHKCYLHTGSADNSKGGTSLLPPVKGEGTYLDAQCRIATATTSLLPATFDAEWSRPAGARPMGARQWVGWRLDSNYAFPRGNVDRLENAGQGVCGKDEWQVAAFSRNSTKWECCDRCPGGTGKCFDDCGCKCSRARTCSDIARKKDGCFKWHGCNWDYASQTCQRASSMVGAKARMSVYIKFPGTDRPLPNSQSVGFRIGGQMRNEWVEGLSPDTWHHVSATAPTKRGQDTYLLVFDTSSGAQKVQFSDLRLEVFDEEPLTNLTAVPLREGVHLWRDAPYTLGRVPANLLGADLFQLPVRTFGSFTVEVQSGNAVHVLFEPGRDAGLEAFLRSDTDWWTNSTPGAFVFHKNTLRGALAIASRQVVAPAKFDLPAVVSEGMVGVLITGTTSASTVANSVVLQDSCRPTDLFSPERIRQSSGSLSSPSTRPAATLCTLAAAILAILLALPR